MLQIAFAAEDPDVLSHHILKGGVGGVGILSLPLERGHRSARVRFDVFVFRCGPLRVFLRELCGAHAGATSEDQNIGQ